MRNLLLAIGMAVTAFVAFQFIHTSELERVEEEMERLFDLAAEGGEDAADEILDAFAEDYRGTGPFKLTSVQRTIRSALVPAGTAKDLKRGGFQPVKKGEEILVPIVRVSGEVRGNSLSFIVSVMWARREGEWKIVQITRWRPGE